MLGVVIAREASDAISLPLINKAQWMGFRSVWEEASYGIAWFVECSAAVAAARVHRGLPGIRYEV